jgi:hypothetical protein
MSQIPSKMVSHSNKFSKANELKTNSFKIVLKGYQKKRNVALISKMCRSLAKGKKMFTQKLIFQALRKV